ncbi:3-methylmercaptopropionyl-CoA dehydrogenase [Candidatus Magnetomoraceae bacterium gMMP-13]
MEQLIADRRDVDFVLYEQLDIACLSKHDKFTEFNKKIIDLIISEARNLAVKEILPTMREGDKEGCGFNSGKVTVPVCFHRIYDLIKKGEWIALEEDPKWGGQGTPRTVALAAHDYLIGANFPFMIYSALTHGAGQLIERIGTDTQKKLFLKKLYSGEWTGTMVLTEAQAGSDVGAINTTAIKNNDETYSISGNKIFISGGEHDLVENIVHLVLARIKDAPSGTRGISLFIVPKYRVNNDGSCGKFNNVICTGIEEKMGIHGNATCSLSLGEKGKCVGSLLGEENKGMKAMFLMINEARHLVGLQGLVCSSSAYLYALNYARQRIQGKNILKFTDPNAPLVPIIQHPDVRRQLLSMKSYVEGMRSLIYYTGFCSDMIKISENEEEKIKYAGIIQILTPIVKGYITDRAFEICSQAVQVYGGYGFTKEYPVEQLLRDSRVTMIYEGTNGIQAMDLVGRKLSLNKGKNFINLFDEIQNTIKIAKNNADYDIDLLANKLEKALNKLNKTAVKIGQTAKSSKILKAYAFAHPFMEVTGDVIMAWMLLWRASIAGPKLKKLTGGSDPDKRRKKVEKNKNAAFYEGQLRSAEFFINSILPITMGKMEAILEINGAAIDIPESCF